MASKYDWIKIVITAVTAELKSKLNNYFVVRNKE